jgi:thiamine transporter ThiT
MKKIISGLILTSLLLAPIVVFGKQTGVVETAPTRNIFPVLDRIVDIVFTVLLIFAALMLIVAAYQFVTAGGDASKVSEARNKVMYALIGVIIAFLARGLVEFIDQFVVDPGTGTETEGGTE